MIITINLHQYLKTSALCRESFLQEMQRRLGERFADFEYPGVEGIIIHNRSFEAICLRCSLSMRMTMSNHFQYLKQHQCIAPDSRVYNIIRVTETINPSSDICLISPELYICRCRKCNFTKQFKVGNEVKRMYCNHIIDNKYNLIKDFNLVHQSEDLLLLHNYKTGEFVEISIQQ